MAGNAQNSSANPATYSQNQKKAAEDAWKEMNDRFSQLYRQGKYGDAEALAQQLVNYAESKLGSEDPKFAVSLNNLAAVYLQERKYAQAEPSFQRALALRKKVLGPDHPGIADTLDNLAAVYEAQRKYSQEAPLYQEALAIRIKTLGPDHPEVARTLRLLGDAHAADGKYSEAEASFQQLLSIQTKTLGSQNPQLVETIYLLASVYVAQGRYKEAEPLYQQALAIRTKAFGAEHSDVGLSLNSLGELYIREGKYKEAGPLLEQGLKIQTRATGSENSEDVARMFNDLASLDLAEGRYGEAEPLYQKALTVRRRVLGDENPQVATTLAGLASLYEHQGRYAEAENTFQQAATIETKTLGPEHRDLAASLIGLGSVFREEGKYSQAEQAYQQALAIRKKALGPNHPETAQSLNEIADLYSLEGKYPQAEPFYKQALEIRERILGPTHPAIADTLNSMGMLYQEEGRYGAAEPMYQKALAIRKNLLGPEHPSVAESLDGLASLYKNQGRYEESEALYEQALAIRKKALGPEHPNVAQSLNNLAELYKLLGKYVEAESFYQQALEIDRKTRKDTREFAIETNNLALLYQTEGRFADAEPLYQQAWAIDKKTLSPGDPSLAVDFNNLGGLYKNEGKYEEAEPLYQQALAINKRALGPDHPTTATSLNNLAGLYVAEGKYAQAEAPAQESLAIYTKTFGPEHPEVGVSLGNLALLYYGWNRPLQAQKYFDGALHVLQVVVEKQFAYMGEKERLDFLATVDRVAPAYSSFVYQHATSESSAKLYNMLLWKKGMVAYSIAGVRAKIAGTGDKQAFALLDTIEKINAQVARAVTFAPSDVSQWEQARQQIAQLEQEKNEAERELVKTSSAIASQREEVRATWESVRAKLRAGEAAIEFVRFDFHDGRHWTGKGRYAALVLTSESSTGPVFVPLGDAAELECAPLNNYRLILGMKADCLPCSSGTAITPSAITVPASPTFYQAFWKPLESTLKDATRIYLSADGVLNQVSLAVVPDESGQLLIEKHDLRSVISTRDLLHEHILASEKNAVLIGDPKFDISAAEQHAALNFISTQQSQRPSTSLPTVDVLPNSLSAQLRRGDSRSAVLSDLTWPPLPWTRAEVNQIQRLLQQRSWQVDIYLGENALEEVIARLHGPRLLHIATHGFFLDDRSTPQACDTGSPRSNSVAISNDSPSRRPLIDDPMLRSGLVFTGGNHLANGEAIPKDLDDGILTAYEASGIDLEGTELVILSACKTGLGRASASEGVFGLRRALQVAGAQSVLMSMWEVSDIETKRLMTLFYEKWLGGEEKHQALRDAQLALREEIKSHSGHDDPEKWGAFVLVGP